MLVDRPPCPKCGSKDTAKYKWPSDPPSQHMARTRPNAQICLSCSHIWFGI